MRTESVIGLSFNEMWCIERKPGKIMHGCTAIAPCLLVEIDVERGLTKPVRIAGQANKHRLFENFSTTEHLLFIK
jgi:hypothetical protein